MTFLDSIFGRTGNRMFQMAALYAFAHKYNSGDIFFTDSKWFAGHEREIKIMLGKGINGEEPINKVAVHVRRGDFMSPPQSLFHYNLGKTDYYEQAVKLFPDATFLIFCADREDPDRDLKDKQWCQEYFNKIIPGRFEISNYQNGEVDMQMMARCKHQIIANSSFSWWAAYLNPNPDKIVVCAEETFWCCDGIPRIRVEKSWKQIKPLVL